MLTLIIILALLSFLFVAFAGACSAAMDVVDFRFSISIFNQPNNLKKIFGHVWNEWFNQSESWKNKYVDRDPNKPLVMWNFLGFKFNPVQLLDSWHFFKMLMVGFLIISIVLMAAAAFLAAIYFMPISLTAAILSPIAIFIINAFMWNVSFNTFFDTLLIKKNFRK